MWVWVIQIKPAMAASEKSEGKASSEADALNLLTRLLTRIIGRRP